MVLSAPTVMTSCTLRSGLVYALPRVAEVMASCGRCLARLRLQPHATTTCRRCLTRPWSRHRAIVPIVVSRPPWLRTSTASCDRGLARWPRATVGSHVGLMWPQDRVVPSCDRGHQRRLVRPTKGEQRSTSGIVRRGARELVEGEEQRGSANKLGLG